MAKALPFRRFTAEENETWRLMFEGQEKSRQAMIHPIFAEGVRRLGIGPKGVPDLEEINRRLESATGFRGVPVEGLEGDETFYEMLAERRFPIGNFIRERGDLSYTPAPDVIHDLYGHLPFLANREYADFCAELGRLAANHRDKPELLKQYARLFWFAIEFGLSECPEGRRIFGAGIASSIGECRYALSARPEVLPFDIDAIRKREFKIDEFQRTLFVIPNPGTLYACLPEFERRALAG